MTMASSRPRNFSDEEFAQRQSAARDGMVRLPCSVMISATRAELGEVVGAAVDEPVLT